LPPVDANSPASGPTITFQNDDPNGTNPNQSISTATAAMVEDAVKASGAQSININSTIGGKHAPSSRHYQHKAVDINKINGTAVHSPANAQNDRALQNAFGAERNIRENFGPTYQEKTSVPGGSASPWPGVGEDHQNHIHESGQD